jgi:hypothetical protein
VDESEELGCGEAMVIGLSHAKELKEGVNYIQLIKVRKVKRRDSKSFVNRLLADKKIVFSISNLLHRNLFQQTENGKIAKILQS